MSTASGFVRSGAAAVGIAAAVLGLAGCQAGGSAVASGDVGSATVTVTSSPSTSTVQVVQLPVSASAAASATKTETATVTSATMPPVTPAPPQTTSALPPMSSIPPSPTPSPCALPEQFFVHIVSVGFDSATSLHQIVAQPAKALCGGGLPDDVEYTITGPAVPYDVNPSVKITGMNQGGQPFAESWAQFAASNLDVYGGFYGIDVNGGVEVLVIDQYFHP
jgi:hypothetical protein